MNNRLTIQDLADMLAERTGKDRKNAELFLKEFITLITKGVYTDKIVKVKGVGTFKIILVERRESIHVNTGERFIIPEHYKFSFLPDKELKDLVNKPFSFFETTELNEDVEFSDLNESVQDSRDADPEDESIEEVLPDKEMISGRWIEEPIEIQGPIGTSGGIVIRKAPLETADRLTPPEELVGEIYRPGRPEETTRMSGVETSEISAVSSTSQPSAKEISMIETSVPERGSSASSKEASIPQKEQEQTSFEEEITCTQNDQTEESFHSMGSGTQKQPVRSESYTLHEDRIAETTQRVSSIEPSKDLASESFVDEASQSEQSVKQETAGTKDLNPMESESFSKPLIPKKPNGVEETIETEELEEDNPYSDDLEFTGETRRPTREGASFKKSVVLFFMVAILLIAGAYAYLNKDIVSGLIRGVTVPPLDTTEVSDSYIESEEVMEEKIREIAEAHSIELPDPYMETDRLSATSGSENVDTLATSTVAPTEMAPENEPRKAGVQIPSSQTPDVASVTTPNAKPSVPAQTLPKPAVSSGKALAVVKIEPGSRLTLISLKYYGSKIFWVYLYEHNKSRIHDPNNVPIGTEIEVPAPELYGIDAHSRESINRASVKQTEILTGK